MPGGMYQRSVVGLSLVCTKGKETVTQTHKGGEIQRQKETEGRQAKTEQTNKHTTHTQHTHTHTHTHTHKTHTTHTTHTHTHTHTHNTTHAQHTNRQKRLLCTRIVGVKWSRVSGQLNALQNVLCKAVLAEGVGRVAQTEHKVANMVGANVSLDVNLLSGRVRGDNGAGSKEGLRRVGRVAAQAVASCCRRVRLRVRPDVVGRQRADVTGAAGILQQKKCVVQV